MPAPPLDVAGSIITQVTKDSENNNDYIIADKDEISLKDSCASKDKKVGQKKLIHSMFCCFGRPKRKFVPSKCNLQEEKWLPALPEKTETTLPPTPAIPNAHSHESDVEILDGSQTHYLLPSKADSFIDKKCAVIDLDETLVHSSFQPISNADFIVPVEIEGTVHQVYVLKRPHVDTYLQRMGEMFECVLFTASLSKYADPVADLLDKEGVFTSRLFRESCVFHRGNYVKDLSVIGRELHEVIIIDNSPASYIFHPDNAVPIPSWFDDPNDRELLDLLPILEAIAQSDDIYSLLQSQGFTMKAKQSTASILMQLQQQMQMEMPVNAQDTNEHDER